MGVLREVCWRRLERVIIVLCLSHPTRRPPHVPRGQHRVLPQELPRGGSSPENSRGASIRTNWNGEAAGIGFPANPYTNLTCCYEQYRNAAPSLEAARNVWPSRFWTPSFHQLDRCWTAWGRPKEAFNRIDPHPDRVWSSSRRQWWPVARPPGCQGPVGSEPLHVDHPTAPGALPPTTRP